MCLAYTDETDFTQTHLMSPHDMKCAVNETKNVI